jgi:hypothetical protein
LFPRRLNSQSHWRSRLVCRFPVSESELGATTFDPRKAIYRLLPLGKSSIERIAQGLDITVKGLQRRLDAESASFSDHPNVAVRYLSNRSYRLLQVAEILGITG